MLRRRRETAFVHQAGMATPATGLHWRRSAGVLTASEGNRLILLQVRKGMFFGLEGVGASIWDLLNAGASAAAIADALLAEYAAPPEQLETDVINFLAQLAAVGVIEQCPPAFALKTLP
jgi:hypothetical protein